MFITSKIFSEDEIFATIIIINLTMQLVLCLSENDNLTKCSSASEALLLTDLLEAGQIQEAQEASRVRLNDFPDLVSYSGYFTVNKTFNSNLFFWFFPAANGNESAPLMLWLQGGPGSSSLYGLFVENGPFYLGKDFRLKSRKYSWASTYSVLYIDNPVGSGYSFTDLGGYSTDEFQVGENLYAGLIQFFTLFPKLQFNDFYVTGESYAGMYIPAVCYTIHEKNPTATLKINLNGLAIGNGWIDPVSMVKYGDLLYQISLVDANGRDIFKQKEQEIVESIQQKRWLDALNNFDELFGTYEQYPSIFKKLTGFDFFLNFLAKDDYTVLQKTDVEEYLSTESVRKTLHVGYSSSKFQISNIEVEKYLLNSYMQSVKPWFEVLMENYRILLYYGQLDIVDPYVTTESFLDSLCWSGAQEYRRAARKKWYVGKDLAGYSKTAKNFKLVLVRNSGHLVPTDQSTWAFDMISRFVDRKDF